MMELKWLLLGEWLNKGFRMYSETFDYTGPIAAMIYKYLYLFFGRSFFAHHLISSFLIIFQAGLFNSILLKNKAFDENNYLPAFFYVVVILSIPDFMALSPQLMSMTFILKALSNVLRRIDNQVTDELFLNSGLFVGLASMIYLPSSIFFFVFLISLMVFSTAIPRRLLLFLFGFCLIMTLCYIYFLWRGDHGYFLDSFIFKGLMLKSEYILSTPEILTIASGLIIFLVTAMLQAILASRLTNFQQRLQQVIWFMFFGGLVCFFLVNKKTVLELILLTPLIAYFLTHYSMLIRKRIVVALMPAIVVFGLLGFSFYCYENLVDPMKVVNIGSYDGNIMVLNESFGYYASNEIGTPCFSQSLCEEAFDGLIYYQESANIFDLFVKANPEVVVDEIEVMPRVFHRFPQLEKEYQKTGANIYSKISN